MSELETQSFRNLVIFYADELRAMENGGSPFTKSEKRALCKHGVCESQPILRGGKNGRQLIGRVSVLTPKAREVIRAIKEIV